MSTHEHHHDQPASVKTHIAPVCGMTVEESPSAITAEYKGMTYYFCAPGCKRSFEKDPEKYLKPGASEQPQHHGCAIDGCGVAQLVSLAAESTPMRGAAVKQPPWPFRLPQDNAYCNTSQAAARIGVTTRIVDCLS